MPVPRCRLRLRRLSGLGLGLSGLSRLGLGGLGGLGRVGLAETIWRKMEEFSD
jgi:hypothetical protein